MQYTTFNLLKFLTSTPNRPSQLLTPLLNIRWFHSFCSHSVAMTTTLTAMMSLCNMSDSELSEAS